MVHLIVGFGFDRSGSGAGEGSGYLGLPFPANAPPNLTPEIWYGFTRNQQELYLKDLNRSESQTTYYQDSDYAKVYDYKTQFDESILDPARDTYEDVIDTATNVGKTGLEIAFIGILAAVLLGRK